jgi:ubiquinone/menaquinone biosynthesis C-methylase UbiE
MATRHARFKSAGHAACSGTRPRYEARLAAYHRAFAPELQAILDALPLGAGMRVLDFACGDGYYASRLARRLGASGIVVGVDQSEGYLHDATADAADADDGSPGATVVYARAVAGALPFADDTFDLVWCAQSLFSLADPVEALRHMARVTRPGGLVAVLENDTAHELCLP